MGRPREYHERPLLRPWVPDVLSMLVIAQLSFVPTLLLANDHGRWIGPWLLTVVTVGLVMKRVDELLIPVETALRWNDWGFAVVDRSGRVTRSLAWSSVGSFRIDRSTGGDVLVLTTADREVSIGTVMRTGDLTLSVGIQRALVAGLRHLRVHEYAGRDRARRPFEIGWTRDSIVLAVVAFASCLLAARWIAPSASLAAPVLPALWLARRVDGFVRALRASWTGHGMRRARVVHVTGHTLVVDDDGRELVTSTTLADPRDGFEPRSAALGRPSWCHGDWVLVTPEAIAGGYRSAMKPYPRSIVSIRDRNRARGTVALALCAACVVTPATTLAAPSALVEVIPWLTPRP